MGPSPEPALLWRVLRHLERTRNHRGVVALVERWVERGDIPLEALLVEARVLFHLRALALALERLRQVSEVMPDHTEALVLGARVFLERGRVRRARTVVARIQEIDPHHPEIPRLEEELLLPQEEIGDLALRGFAEQLTGCERLIARGSGASVRPVLEELRRRRPDNGRVADLLWAMDGDFRGPLSLDELARIHAPPEGLGEWDQLEHTESVAYGLLEPDLPTAYVPRLDDRGKADAPKKDLRFPSLFRTLEDDDDDRPGGPERTGESTHVMQLDDGTRTDGGETTFGHARTDADFGDTAVMSVIGRPHDGPAGPSPRPAPEGSDYDEAEMTEADEGLVQLLPKWEKGRVDDMSTPALPRRPIEVIEKYPEPVPLEPPEPPLQPVLDPVPPEPLAFDELPARAARRWAPLGALAAGLLIGVLLVALALFGLFEAYTGRTVAEGAARAIVQGDLRRLLETEATLEAQIAANTPPVERRRVSLAMVDAALWWQYTGDPAHRDRALDALAHGSGGGRYRAIAHVLLGLGAHDLDAARKDVAHLVPEEALDRALLAEVHLRAGDPLRAREVLAPVLAHPGDASPLEVTVALRSLEDPQAREGFATASGQLLHPLVALTHLETTLGSMDDAAAFEAIRSFAEREPGLPARLEGRVYALRATLDRRAGRTAEASDHLRKALIADSWNPAYLAAEAELSLFDNRVVQALGDAERCLLVAPVDERCRRLVVQSLVELDRLDEAAERSVHWAPDLQWWSKASSPLKDRAEALGRAPETAVGAYAEAWAALLLDEDPTVALAAVTRAEAALSGSNSPADAVLLRRMVAARTILSGGEALTVLDDAAATDPIVEVLLARSLEARGSRVRAEEHLDRAVEIGPENGFALHTLGLYHYDPRRDPSRAVGAWRDYLELEPSGDRAVRARERVGRR